MSVTERLKKLLEENHAGSFSYHFKFVMPLAAVEEFSRLIPEVNSTSRMSSNSRFVSISFDFEAQSAQEIIDIYERVRLVPGLLSL